MRFLLALIAILIAAFFAISFTYASVLIVQGRAGPYVDKHGWSSLIVMQTPVALGAGLFAWAGQALLGNRNTDCRDDQ
jgi:hypothetical protein